MLKRTLVTTVTSLLVGLLPAAVVASPAMAASSDGAQHLHISDCSGFFCFDIDQLINTTINDNILSVFVHGDSTIIYDDGTCRTDTSLSESSRQAFKIKQGEDQVVTFKQGQTSFFSACGSHPPQTCTFGAHYVFSNGVFQFERIDEPTCTDT